MGIENFLSKKEAQLPKRKKLHAGEWIVPTDRSLDQYMNYLELARSELENKTVLDVGSGIQEKFSRQAQDLYNCKVISVNPKLKGWVYRKILEKFTPDWQRKSVAAAAEELPFVDNYFDTATSLWAVSPYLKKEGRFQAVKEIIRTLKPGGKLHIAPRGSLEKWDKIAYAGVINEEVLGEEVIEWLRDNGHDIESHRSFGAVIIRKKSENQ